MLQELLIDHLVTLFLILLFSITLYNRRFSSRGTKRWLGLPDA